MWLVDTDAFLKLLNDDLRTEYQSIVQYIQHVAVIKGPEYLSTIDELRAHVNQEIQHALVLAEQIDFLGGVPTVEVSSALAAAGAKEALEADLSLETHQLERYRERFQQATDLGLADVAEALRPLLTETQEHVRDLQAALGQ
ncbi:MAG: putative Bacterioferritin [Acidimicrobiales bacterium]|nr:putative Bacterioferritin [Acidimicrobiales bacterium]